MTKEEAAVLIAFNAISDQLQKTAAYDQLKQTNEKPQADSDQPTE
ncbi:hypothetical protein [Secundilactobacillus odoratitofui]